MFMAMSDLLDAEMMVQTDSAMTSLILALGACLGLKGAARDVARDVKEAQVAPVDALSLNDHIRRRADILAYELDSVVGHCLNLLCYIDPPAGSWSERLIRGT